MEVCEFFFTRATPAAEAASLRSVAVGTSTVTVIADDLQRSAELVERYSNLPLGAAGSSRPPNASTFGRSSRSTVPTCRSCAPAISMTGTGATTSGYGRHAALPVTLQRADVVRRCLAEKKPRAPAAANGHPWMRFVRGRGA